MTTTEDQTPVIELLAAPSTHGGNTVERIETHISIVFLAGARAWKLKRAVLFDYVNASTVDRRKTLCEEEVRLNRRTAPSLYLGVVAVTRQADGSLALGGSGSPVDWVVEMRRFDEHALLDRLAEEGRLDLAVMAPLASAIASFHRTAVPRRDHGGLAGMRWVADGNAAGLREFGPGILDHGSVELVTAATWAAIDASAPLLDARRECGFVRHCHGDLHLRNIVMHEGRPTLFDGVEFNDEIACIDVLYDLAFLLMDLWRRGMPAHANAVWNQYLSAAGDFDGIGLMPLFLSCRAAVRAKTSATSARVQTTPDRARALEAAAREYLAMADQLLHPPPPCLAAIGGLSGSGKSTLARAIAPMLGAVPGAIVIRSDEVRKAISGVPDTTRLGADAYKMPVNEKVYARLAERAATALRGGSAVIVDATFLRPDDREAVEAIARGAGVPFHGFWLDAPPAILLRRLESRGPDASDADAAVLRLQIAQDRGALTWCTLDGSMPMDEIRREAAALLPIFDDRDRSDGTAPSTA
ncbi:MAG: AAA family ATPase [Vicinamibacterales bacterium]